jgi:hypothetical protein
MVLVLVLEMILEMACVEGLMWVLLIWMSMLMPPCLRIRVCVHVM